MANLGLEIIILTVLIIYFGVFMTHNIYKQYEKEILNTIKLIREIDPNFNNGIGSNNFNFFIELIKKLLPRKIKNIIKKFL